MAGCAGAAPATFRQNAINTRSICGLKDGFSGFKCHINGLFIGIDTGQLGHQGSSAFVPIRIEIDGRTAL
jgi:hypothetical protein